MPNAIQAKQKIYLDVAKAPKADLDKWRRGVSIEARAGETIDSIVSKACSFRLRLALDFLRCGRQEFARPRPNYRLVIGRGYYSMYHYSRALVYFIHGGDDHESHSNVAKAIPEDLDQRAAWANKLRIARLERNRADYDPFPLADSSYKSSATQVIEDAGNWAMEVKSYLRAKGLAI